MGRQSIDGLTQWVPTATIQSFGCNIIHYFCPFPNVINHFSQFSPWYGKSNILLCPQIKGNLFDLINFLPLCLYLSPSLFYAPTPNKCVGLVHWHLEKGWGIGFVGILQDSSNNWKGIFDRFCDKMGLFYQVISFESPIYSRLFSHEVIFLIDITMKRGIFFTYFPLQLHFGEVHEFQHFNDTNLL